MNRYSIYLNYNLATIPIGFVELDDEIRVDVIREGAIVPYLRKGNKDENYSVVAFGFISRTSVDTRSREPSEGDDLRDIANSIREIARGLVNGASSANEHRLLKIANDLEAFSL